MHQGPARPGLASVDAKLVAAFGVPANVPDGVELRADHGLQYTGTDSLAPAPHLRARRPRTGNAAVERFIRTLKEGLANLGGEVVEQAPVARSGRTAEREASLSRNQTRPRRVVEG